MTPLNGSRRPRVLLVDDNDAILMTVTVVSPAPSASIRSIAIRDDSPDLATSDNNFRYDLLLV